MIRIFSKTGGFTIVEVVVMMLIITTISAIVLVSFTGLHEGAAVNRSARELALAIRRAQNMSLAVTEINTLAGPRIPAAVGLRLAQDSQTFFFFADLVRDNKYDAEIVPEEDDARLYPADEAFEGGVRVRALAYYDALGRLQTVPVMHIVFVAPEAAVMLTDEGGGSIGETAVIELATRSGQLSKTVTIRTSGQVSIK